MIKKKELSKKDREIWDSYIKNPNDIFDKDSNNLNLDQRISRFKFDLHGFSLDQANAKVREIILYCIEKKYRELLLITGKGIHSNNNENSYVSKEFGKLKFSVPEFIKSDDELSKLIISISSAEKKDGGEGAILLKLKKL